MYVPWQSSTSLLRSRLLRAIALLATTGMLINAQSKINCSVPEVKVAWTIDLNACRPRPINSVNREEVVRALPVAGSVLQLGAKERGKLKAIEQVLRVNDREGIYEIRVIAVPQVWTGLHERAVLLITYPALTLLHIEELQALVAHELGHEYVWDQYLHAKVHKDRRRTRNLELACDVIAIRTLLQMGLQPKFLQTATEKAFWYNRERFGAARNQGDYPSLKERRQVIEHRFPLGNSYRRQVLQKQMSVVLPF